MIKYNYVDNIHWYESLSDGLIIAFPKYDGFGAGGTDFGKYMMLTLSIYSDVRNEMKFLEIVIENKIIHDV